MKEEGEGGKCCTYLHAPRAVPRAAPPWIPAGAGAAAMDLAPAVVDLALVTVVVVDAPAAAAARREKEGCRRGSAPCRSAPWRGREEGHHRGEARSVGDAVVDAAATLLWRSLPPGDAGRASSRSSSPARGEGASRGRAWRCSSPSAFVESSPVRSRRREQGRRRCPREQGTARRWGPSRRGQGRPPRWCWPLRQRQSHSA